MALKDLDLKCRTCGRPLVYKGRGTAPEYCAPIGAGRSPCRSFSLSLDALRTATYDLPPLDAETAKRLRGELWSMGNDIKKGA